MTFNEETSNATITLKGRDGVNRATATVSQTPVKLTLNPASIVFENGQPNQTATVTVGTTNDGTISSGLTVSPQSKDWFIASVSGNKVIVKTTTENDTGVTRPDEITITYKGTSIKISVKQNCDFNPNQTVNIGGVEWMRYNLAKSRLEGTTTFATKLPSECADDPIKTKSHGRFYQWDIGNKSWPSTEISVTDWDKTNPPTQNVSWLESNDPCPLGYHVPTQEEFLSLKNNTTQTNAGGWSASDYGYKIFKNGNASLELPAIGYRNDSTGSLKEQGTSGNYWTASSYDGIKAGVVMLFYEQSISLFNSYYKSCGRSIRCVKN